MDSNFLANGLNKNKEMAVNTRKLFHALVDSADTILYFLWRKNILDSPNAD